MRVLREVSKLSILQAISTVPSGINIYNTVLELEDLESDRCR